MKPWILSLFIFSTCVALPQQIRVRLFSQYSLENIWVTTYKSDFHLIALDKDHQPLDTIADYFPEALVRTLMIKKQDSKLEIVNSGNSLGSYEGLYLSAKEGGHFIIAGKGKERIYSGNLIIALRDHHLLVVNEVDLEEYVAGVVESEGGHVALDEYFKAQAILARTWALRNWEKHLDEGYNVKDDVSSQAYYSKAYLQNSEMIIQAVTSTEDTVLLDRNGKLVFGAFHSNSGGQTSNSEDIWSQEIDYLRSVKDTFSLKGSRATWEREVSKAQFVAFFASKLKTNDKDSVFMEQLMNLKMDERKPWFHYNGRKVKMRDVRTRFKLKSSFFSVEDRGSSLLLKGRGFGHGVGLSQQGAMEMSRQGMNFRQILQFYFKEVRLGHLNSVFDR